MANWYGDFKLMRFDDGPGSATSTSSSRSPPVVVKELTNNSAQRFLIGTTGSDAGIFKPVLSFGTPTMLLAIVAGHRMCQVAVGMTAANWLDVLLAWDSPESVSPAGMVFL